MLRHWRFFVAQFKRNAGGVRRQDYARVRKSRCEAQITARLNEFERATFGVALSVTKMLDGLTRIDSVTRGMRSPRLTDALNGMLLDSFADYSGENRKMSFSGVTVQETDSSVFTQRNGAEKLPAPDNIVVAIHGIGSPRRSSTVRAAVRRFCARNQPPLPVMPLGFFNIGGVGEVCVGRLDVPKDDELARIGFAEVYWADVPRGAVKQGDTLEESKAWGATVAGRARALYTSVEQAAARNKKHSRLTPDAYSLAAGVIDEMVEAVGVMENLLTVTGKAGVQLAAEFRYYRSKIVFRFHDAIQAILAQFQKDHPEFNGDPEIHIVAHSEGTVIAFIATLQALSCDAVVCPDDKSRTISTDWIKSVRGFMTIGSPIDKHILLWPKLWLNQILESNGFKTQSADAEVVMLRPAREKQLILPRPIKWRNYYDLGDPTGFQLDTARGFLGDHKCGAFQFTPVDDTGFCRYWQPGKAHADYWNNDAVFGYFIENLVLTDSDAPSRAKAPPPGSKRFVELVSTAIPYLLAFLLHMGALFLLFRAAMASLKLDGDTYPSVTSSVFVLSVLLMSATVAGRLPKLVHSDCLRWQLLGVGTYAMRAWLDARDAEPRGLRRRVPLS